LFDYISNTLFTDWARSDKTEAAMNYTSEDAKANDCCIFILYYKPDWKKLGKHIGSRKYTCNPLEER